MLVSRPPRADAAEFQGREGYLVSTGVLEFVFLSQTGVSLPQRELQVPSLEVWVRPLSEEGPTSTHPSSLVPGTLPVGTDRSGKIVLGGVARAASSREWPGFSPLVSRPREVSAPHTERFHKGKSLSHCLPCHFAKSWK